MQDRFAPVRQNAISTLRHRAAKRLPARAGIPDGFARTKRLSGWEDVHGNAAAAEIQSSSENGSQ